MVSVSLLCDQPGGPHPKPGTGSAVTPWLPTGCLLRWMCVWESRAREGATRAVSPVSGRVTAHRPDPDRAVAPRGPHPVGSCHVGLELNLLRVQGGSAREGMWTLKQSTGPSVDVLTWSPPQGHRYCTRHQGDLQFYPASSREPPGAERGWPSGMPMCTQDQTRGQGPRTPVPGSSGP